MAGEARFDSIDRQILREVQVHGRTAVITGYTATPDTAALGRGTEAMLSIVFRSHARPLVDPFVGVARWPVTSPRRLAECSRDDD